MVSYRAMPFGELISRRRIHLFKNAGRTLDFKETPAEFLNSTL